MAPKQASGRVSRAKPAVQRPARRAAPPKSPKTETIPAKGGAKPITFTKGGLHKSLGVPPDQPIPAGKMADALAGKAGPLAKKQAVMARGFLAKGRKTAAKNKKG
jgi:hypothetical protein